MTHGGDTQNSNNMTTLIHPSPIFGPIRSRRLGLSLGINLMPADGKICTFDCIYCECGYNAHFRPLQRRPSREEVRTQLERRLQQMQADGTPPDVLTFSGNGEPTAHPEFDAVIADTLQLRDKYFPNAKISVLSNATLIHRPKVRDALMQVDNNILKLDTVSNSYIKKLDRPSGKHYDVNKIVENMKLFEGKFIVQTMFLKGQDDEGNDMDNTHEEYIKPWLDTLKAIRPQAAMIYTIDRETPASSLLKADAATLNAIRDRVMAIGIPCSASY